MTTRSEIINRILIVFILFGIFFQAHCRFEFTNLKCSTFDKSFCEFDYCYLKSVNRTYKYASLKLKMHQLPIPKVYVRNYRFIDGRVALSKRLNGYKPFLYNMTLDLCKFLRTTNHGNKVANFYYSLVKPYSNINHSCPYNHDLVVDKLPISFLNQKFTDILPLPEGDYRITGTMILFGIDKAEYSFYFTKS